MEHSPIMPVGKYAGHRIDQLPNAYLRWMLTQNFPTELLNHAEAKLKNSSYNDLHLNVTRHAVDMFSKRFLSKWILEEGSDEGDGLGTYIAKQAELAWTVGEDVSKGRYNNDSINKLYDGIVWAFQTNTNFPEYKDLVTVMEAE